MNVNKSNKTADFINQAIKVHGDRYDYSKTVYSYAREKLLIVCKIHGEFLQYPNHHLKGCGCNKCGNIEIGKKLSKSTDEFIAEAKSLHGEKYSYIHTVYINSKTPVKILCEKHGEFLQSPVHHLKGHGCPKCGVEHVRAINLKTTEEFIKEAKQAHGDTYNYDKVVYVHGKTPVEILCKEHGSFFQMPDHHRKGHGCMQCNHQGRGWRKRDWVKYCEEKGIMQAVLYAIEFSGEDELFVKIGITTNLKQRLAQIPYRPVVIKTVKGSPMEIYDSEKRMIALFKKYKYTPKVKFGGSTECFTLAIKGRA